ALPARGPHPVAVRAQPRRRRRARVVRPAGPARALRRAPGRQPRRPRAAADALPPRSSALPPQHPRMGHKRPVVCLSRLGASRISLAMRLVPLILACMVALPGLAQAQRKPAAKPPPTGPSKLGEFEDWIAATHEEGGQATCYAFVRAANSVPVLAGR